MSDYLSGKWEAGGIGPIWRAENLGGKCKSHVKLSTASLKKKSLFKCKIGGTDNNFAEKLYDVLLKDICIMVFTV